MDELEIDQLEMVPTYFQSLDDVEIDQDEVITSYMEETEVIDIELEGSMNNLTVTEPIRIRAWSQICENTVPELEPEEGSDGNYAFSCALCSKKFKKKLFLNNHMEKRHGIKFVFTEKGKKVKLVRMPQELTEGEKLDPCVEVLLQQNGQNASNILGVETMEPKLRLPSSRDCPTAHEVDPYDLIQGKKEREFGAGILTKSIRTLSMRTAIARKETPFVAYRPLRSQRLYLLTIQVLNDNMQLLLPATAESLISGDGIQKEGTVVPSGNSTPDPLALSQEEIKQKPTPTRFSHVAVVALAEQILNENGKVTIKIGPPPPPGPMALIKSLHFSRTIIQCQPKRLRCLSIPPKPVTPRPVVETVNEIDTTTRVKRKYTRRLVNKAKIRRRTRKSKYNEEDLLSSSSSSSSSSSD